MAKHIISFLLQNMPLTRNYLPDIRALRSRTLRAGPCIYLWFHRHLSFTKGWICIECWFGFWSGSLFPAFHVLQCIGLFFMSSSHDAELTFLKASSSHSSFSSYAFARSLIMNCYGVRLYLPEYQCSSDILDSLPLLLSRSYITLRARLHVQ